MMVSTPRPAESTTSAETRARRIDWRVLLGWTGAAQAVVLVAAMVAVGRLIPPVVVITLLYLVGVVLVRRGGISGPLVMAVPSALLIIRNAPLLMDTLAAPAATVDFLSHAMAITLAVANLIAAAAALRGRTPVVVASIVAGATVAALAVTVVVAVVARMV